MGSGGAESRGAGDSRRAGAIWNYFGARGRGAGEDAAAVQTGGRRETGVGTAVNVVAPQPVKNAEFTKVLAKALHRPALFPAPAFALRLALGEMADALLLSSQRVAPQKLEQARFRFAHADLTTALGTVLSAS